MRINPHDRYDENYWVRMNLAEFRTAERVVDEELDYNRGYAEGDSEFSALQRIQRSIQRAREQGIEDAETVEIALHGYDLYVLSVALRVQEAAHDSADDFKNKMAFEMFRRIVDKGKGWNLSYIDPPE